MFDLLESIAVKDGVLMNTSFHEERFRHSYRAYYNHLPPFELLQNLEVEIPLQGYYKLRIQYNENTKKADVELYKQQEIKTLKCVIHNTIDYHLKYTNRDILNDLKTQRDGCDDILIVKNGYISDTFAGNILFDDAQTWITPDTPLLPGTQRAFLLKEGLIRATRIGEADIKHFKRFMVINALRPFNDKRAASISGIK